MATPPVPSRLRALNCRPLVAGAQLVRLHDPAYAGDACNPCKGDPTRFAPLENASGDCLPTLYAASSLECAVHESIFHDLPYDAPRKSIRLDKVISRSVSWLELTGDLQVASLNEPDLNKLKLTRSMLIDTPPSDYPVTARWAEAFHRRNPTIAGLTWTSRRCDPEAGYVFFEDRLPSGAFRVLDTVSVSASGAVLREIRAFGRRAGITITI